MRRNGFTLIELLVTLTVMVILMALAVVMLRTTQMNSRDEERAGDVATIARGLENRYERATISQNNESKPGYPSIEEIRWSMDNAVTGHAKAGNFLSDNLPGTSPTVFEAPNKGTFTVICTSSCGSAENASTIAGATSGDGAKNYIYEPVAANGNICHSISTECVRYNLYYVKESEPNASLRLQTIRSKRQ